MLICLLVLGTSSRNPHLNYNNSKSMKKKKSLKKKKTKKRLSKKINNFLD